MSGSARVAGVGRLTSGTAPGRGLRAASRQAGFTLLEVLVAFAILALALVSLIELTSQGLRLLKLSGDHQEAVLLADRIARETEVSSDAASQDTLDSGEERHFVWERRITRLALPEELEAKATLPGRELPGLYTVSVAVRWGRNQSVEVATLRAPAPSTATAEATAAESPGRVQDEEGVPTPRPGRVRLPGGRTDRPGTREPPR